MSYEEDFADITRRGKAFHGELVELIKKHRIAEDLSLNSETLADFLLDSISIHATLLLRSVLKSQRKGT